MNEIWVTSPIVGSRVYSAGSGQHGSIVSTEKPYMTMDQLLCSIRWDNGETVTLYHNAFICLGPFQTLQEFQSAVSQSVTGAKLTLGPSGGFRGFEMTLQREAQSLRARYGSRDGSVYQQFIAPCLQAAGVEPETVRLERRPRAR